MSDEIVRALTSDGAFRAVTVRLGDASSEVLEAQSPAVGHELLAELLVSSVLVRASMAPKYRVQVSFRSRGATVLADSHPDGMIRGMLSGAGKLPMPGDGVQMHVARLMPEGRLQQGVIESDSSGVSASLTKYMQQSEQITSTIGVLARRARGGVEFASGFILQILPDVEPRSLAEVTSALESLPSDWPSRSAEEMASLVLGEADYTIVERARPFFGCTCDHDRVLGALATMGEEDIRSVIEDEEEISVACEYCRETYTYSPDQMARLLE